MIKLDFNKDEKKHSSAFMGLSLGKKLFYDKKFIKSFASFLNDNFDESFLLIADLPKKYNLIAIDGLSESEAQNKIIIASREMRIFLERTLKEFDNVKVKSYCELQDENYLHNLNLLKEAYKQNKEFREQIRKDVEDFIRLPINKEKILKRGFSIEEAIDISLNYRLDELAILLSIPCRFNGIYEFYPGHDLLHEDLQNGKYPFCKDLKTNANRDFLEVQYGN